MNVVGGCYMDLSLNQSPYVQAGILITGPSIITYLPSKRLHSSPFFISWQNICLVANSLFMP